MDVFEVMELFRDGWPEFTEDDGQSRTTRRNYAIRACRYYDDHMRQYLPVYLDAAPLWLTSAEVRDRMHSITERVVRNLVNFYLRLRLNSQFAHLRRDNGRDLPDLLRFESALSQYFLAPILGRHIWGLAGLDPEPEFWLQRHVDGFMHLVTNEWVFAEE